ncbi:MAG TPA: hypothetical protein VKP69_21335, partial [Isosphaeraceae bacterium]|nr:hypothetical protein [Isosphaeraceae bacterium]
DHQEEDDEQLETDDASGGQESDLNPILPEHRTRPLSLTKAGRFLGITGRPKDVGKQMRRRIDSRRLLCHPQGRQYFIFDVRDFPASSHSKIKPS